MVRTRPKRVKVPALLELSRFHMRQGEVFDTVRRLVKRLEEEGLEYVVAGGDAETGVRIEILTTGDFPGDGKPKPLEERLHPSVRDAYRMVWNEVRDVPRERD